MQKLVLTLSIIFFGTISYSQNPIKSDSASRQVKSDSLMKKSEPVPAQQVQPQKTQRVRKDTRPLKDRIDTDFNVSFWANSHQSYFDASFLVSYLFPKILSVGAGPVYVLSYRKDADENLNGFGGKVFARAQLVKFLYLWTSYQGLSNQYITEMTTNPVTFQKQTGYVDSWFAGAGLNIRLGRRTGFNVSVLYDFLYSKATSPYTSAWTYQFGFGF